MVLITPAPLGPFATRSGSAERPTHVCRTARRIAQPGALGSEPCARNRIAAAGVSSAEPPKETLEPYQRYRGGLRAERPLVTLEPYQRYRRFKGGGAPLVTLDLYQRYRGFKGGAPKEILEPYPHYRGFGGGAPMETMGGLVGPIQRRGRDSNPHALLGPRILSPVGTAPERARTRQIKFKPDVWRAPAHAGAAWRSLGLLPTSATHRWFRQSQEGRR